MTTPSPSGTVVLVRSRARIIQHVLAESFPKVDCLVLMYTGRGGDAEGCDEGSALHEW